MLKTGLQLTISQQLTMTPQLQQAIKLLQLSTIELQSEIQSILESNPLLEAEETVTDIKQTETPEYESFQKDYIDLSSAPKSTLSKAGDDYLDVLNSQEESLTTHLKWQLNTTSLNAHQTIIANIIIDAIDENGYVTQLDNEIIDCVKKETGVLISQEALNTVINTIQQFDPIGVGARNLAECLTIQLQHEYPKHPLFDSAKKLIEHHLVQLSKRDYASLKRKLKAKEDDIETMILMIQSLNPKPGRLISSSRTEYIVPDLIVQKSTHGWSVSLNDAALPKLCINHHYVELKNSTNHEASQYVKSQLQEARWFLKSLGSRNETLLKVATQIMSRQQDFLEHGEEAMKPLVLQDIASAIDMHESTISRITTQKFIHTPRGIFELKYFFSSHVGTDNGGMCSSTAIRALIKKLIANENPAKPLSDNQIASILVEQGIHVARRTVAKYREGLNIPSSSSRKRLLT